MSASLEHREALARLLSEVTGGELVAVEPVQSLWSGYGERVRCQLNGHGPASLIVKHVRWPTDLDHPRGWNSDRSHRRKVESYEIEARWYQHHARGCNDACRVPRCLAVRKRGDEVFIVLEDLDAVGFESRRTTVAAHELKACLYWLANFHATFVGQDPEGLWNVGTYWHLDTRPDELAVLADGPLKQHAAAIDSKLSRTRYQTLVHGDAKLANFCFSADGRRVAAVDFQYVGGGCGIKDVAYFVSSCLDEDAAEEREVELLAEYFAALRVALANRNSETGSSIDANALCSDWRALYPVAWTDFVRFLKGWSPGHWKIHHYSERLAREVLETL